MIKVGIVGEDPNDTSSIKNLLQKKYKSRVHFLTLVKGIRGYQLDNPKIKKSLPIEFEDKKCSFILYVRDLDAFKSEENKIKAKIKWFKDLDSTVNNKGILLLNIWELEALILADIATFNKLYKTEHRFSGDPMARKEPKEYLKELTRNNKKKYSESDCPDIFEKLNIETVRAKCSFFKEFDNAFDLKLKKP